MATVQELENQLKSAEFQLQYLKGGYSRGSHDQLGGINKLIEITQQKIEEAKAANDPYALENEQRIYRELISEQLAVQQKVDAQETKVSDLRAALAVATTQQNSTQSAGQQVAQSGDAGVTNPAQPPQTFTSPDNTVTTAQTEPVVATANKDTPSIGQSASPSPDATAATVQTNAEEAVGQQKTQAETFTDADRQGDDRATKQSYVFYATKVTSEFRQGRFEQTLEGALYIFPRPKKSQIVDPPAVVTSAELGSQSFGLANNRVNPDKKKVASPQDVRKASIASQTFPVKGVGTSPTNTQVTGQDNTPDTRFFGF